MYDFSSPSRSMCVSVGWVVGGDESVGCGGGCSTQSACEVLWLTTCVFESLSFHIFFFFFFPRVRSRGKYIVRGWGGEREVKQGREIIKEPEIRHVVLVWGATCRDGGSGFSLLQPACVI